MTMTEEQLEILGLASDFAGTEIAPHAEAWDAAGAFPAALFDSLAEMGFTGMVTPEAFGGLELDAGLYAGVLTALGKADASVAVALGVHNSVSQLLAEIDGEGQSALLEAMAGGEIRGTAALREGDLDPDPARIEATSAGDRISGTKCWVVEPSAAGSFLVVAKDGEGLSAFRVAAGEDVTVSSRRVTMGLSAVEIADVTFEGAPAVRIGPAGAGGEVLRKYARYERLAFAAIAAGIAEAARDHAARYSRERAQFGRPLARFDAIQAKLGDIVGRAQAASAAVRSAAGAGIGEAAGAKLVASEAAMFAADEAVQIFGGYGYMRDYPVERLMRDAKGIEVLGGTSETLRRELAHGLLEE